MKPWLLGLAAAFALAAPAGAQPVPGHVFTGDMSSRIDRIAQAEVSGGRTPGIAIGVVEDGRLVYARGFGYANVARHTRVDPSTQFSLGAVSAQFTTAAVLLLVQDAKLKLDDRVTKYVPELSIAANVTVAELLQQTSGLPDYTKAPGIDPDQTHQAKINDLIAAANKMQLVTTPGTTYAPNDFNFIVAGLIVERVSSVTLSDFLQQRIFLPLVMNQTLYAGDTGLAASHAVGYTRTAAGKFSPARTTDPSWLLGARGVVSNVYDLAKWDIEMPILLRVDAVRTMYTPGGIAGPAQYGMGWVIDRRSGKRFMWYNGEIPGYRALNAVLPDDHIAIVVLTNTDSHGGAVSVPVQVAARVLDVVAPP
ncbi:MAG TPA: serine hydrolase domain-containing protein, partial [Candidatus Acidoferrales bacterium]|nr:serine hydrolase domain-containing protein [Candidatus Acidoferrales bacterium]